MLEIGFVFNLECISHLQAKSTCATSSEQFAVFAVASMVILVSGNCHIVPPLNISASTQTLSNATLLVVALCSLKYCFNIPPEFFILNSDLWLQL